MIRKEMFPMEPESPTAAPGRRGLFASVNTWTPHLSLALAQFRRESQHTFLPLTWRAFRLTLLLAVLSGVIFPALLYGIGQALFPAQANGSLITDGQGHVI